MTSELAVRRINTHTAGTITVEQENLSMGDLRDFCHLAEAHGVEPDVVVTIKESYQHMGERGQVRVTTIEVPAPVVFAYNSPPSKRLRRRRAPSTGMVLGVVVALIAVGPVMLIIDLLWKLTRFAFGWL
jgi:hypothetical protein